MAGRRGAGCVVAGLHLKGPFRLAVSPDRIRFDATAAEVRRLLDIPLFQGPEPEAEVSAVHRFVQAMCRGNAEWDAGALDQSGSTYREALAPAATPERQVTALQKIGRARERQGRYAEARGLYRRALDLQSSHPELDYSMMARTHALIGWLDAVLRQDGIARMVKALAGTGQTDAARPLIALLSDSRARAEAFADLAVGLGAAGRRAEAGAALADALRAARAIPAEGAPPNVSSSLEDWHASALTSVAVAQARLGAAPAALKTLGEIPGGDLRWARALSRVARGQAEAGDVAGALRTLSSVSAEGREQVALDALLAIVRAQLRAGDLSGAIQLATATRSAPARTLLFQTVAVRAGRSGARAEAANAVRQALQAAAHPRRTAEVRADVSLLYRWRRRAQATFVERYRPPSPSTMSAGDTLLSRT